MGETPSGLPNDDVLHKMIETPNKQAQLIDKATDLRQGLFLLIAAQQATIAFLSDLLIDARYSSEDEAYASYVKRQRNIQLKRSQVEQSLPKIEHLIHSPSANVRTDTLYVEMMRSANREVAAGLKRYGTRSRQGLIFLYELCRRTLAEPIWGLRSRVRLPLRCANRSQA